MIVDFLPTIELEFENPPRSYRDFVEHRLSRHVRYPGYEPRTRVVIRFHERLDLAGSLMLNDDVFLDPRGRLALKDRTGGHFRVSFQELERERVEIDATRQTDPDSLYGYVLLGVCQLLLERHGLTLVHASAFQTGRHTVLLPAWAGTGKTNLLLAAIGAGAKVISDDLAVLDRDGTLLPYPRPIAIYDYNARWFPDLRRRFHRSRNLWLLGSRTLDVLSALGARVVSERNTALSALRKISSLSKNVLKMFLFPDEINADSGFGEPAPVDVAIWLVRGEGTEIVATDSDLDRLGVAAGICLQDELRFFMTAYQKYRFLTGGTAAPVAAIEELGERSRALVQAGLAGVPVVRLAVPGNCDPAQMLAAIEQVLARP